MPSDRTPKPADQISDRTTFSADDLGGALRDIVEHVDAAGWGQPPSAYALVPTAILAARAPDAVAADDDSALSPVEQECPDLDEFLASAFWPEPVVGAAVTMEIVVAAPPAGESGTPRFARTESGHPDGRTARLVVGVLRSGTELSLLRLRPRPGEDATAELLTHPELATELRAALRATFTPDS